MRIENEPAETMRAKLIELRSFLDELEEEDLGEKACESQCRQRE